LKQLVIPPGILLSGESLVLQGDEYHYLVRVRRCRVGDKISILSGDRSGTAVVENLTPDKITLKVSGLLESEEDSRPLYLFPALLKGSKMDDVLRQGVEAGAAGIFPFGGEFSVGQISREDVKKKELRWQSLVQEAVQQSGAPRVPGTGFLSSVKDLLAFWGERGLLLFFHQIPLAKDSLHGYLSSGYGPVGLIIGPEGGLSPKELQVLAEAGAKPVYLGNRVLRAETASVFALASVRILLEEQSFWKIP